jgi:hypothetical protein
VLSVAVLPLIMESIDSFSLLTSLDMESIDALAKAVNEFEGGMVLVSHDMRLISQVAKEIWICDHKRITVYKGDIQNFKLDMREQMGIEGELKGQLRGDASVVKKAEEESSAPAKVVAAKKSVPTPEPKKDSFDMKPIKEALPPVRPPVVQPAPPVMPAPVVPLVTQTTTAVTAPVTASAGSAPVRGRYIPPHLRNKS